MGEDKFDISILDFATDVMSSTDFSFRRARKACALLSRLVEYSYRMYEGERLSAIAAVVFFTYSQSSRLRPAVALSKETPLTDMAVAEARGHFQALYPSIKGITVPVHAEFARGLERTVSDLSLELAVTRARQ